MNMTICTPGGGAAEEANAADSVRTFSPQNYEKEGLCLSHAACGILLWQP